jgi:hypothetical protein
LGKLLALYPISFAGLYLLVTNNQFDQHNFDLDLFSILRLSDRLTSLTTLGSIFGLMFLGGLVATYRLAAADVATDRTVVSWWSMSAILALTTLLKAGTSDIVSVLGVSPHSLDSSYCFSGLLLVMALGVWAPFACRLGMTDEVLLHLE